MKQATVFTRSKLSAAIKRKGWSQRRLARAAGRSAEAVSRWCRGQSFPGIEDALKVAKILGQPVESIWSLRGWRPRREDP